MGGRLKGRSAPRPAPVPRGARPGPSEVEIRLALIHRAPRATRAPRLRPGRKRRAQKLCRADRRVPGARAGGGRAHGRSDPPTYPPVQPPGPGPAEPRRQGGGWGGRESREKIEREARQATRQTTPRAGRSRAGAGPRGPRRVGSLDICRTSPPPPPGWGESQNNPQPKEGSTWVRGIFFFTWIPGGVWPPHGQCAFAGRPRRGRAAPNVVRVYHEPRRRAGVDAPGTPPLTPSERGS